MRIIDADKLVAQQKEIADDEFSKDACPYSWSYAIESFIDDIEEQPTVDAVPVVRCKDCKYFLPDDKGCNIFYSVTTEDDYCSSGERKDEK